MFLYPINFRKIKNMKNFYGILMTAILFSLFKYYEHNNYSFTQKKLSNQTDNSSVNKNEASVKPSSKNYAPPQKQIDSLPANPNQQVDEGRDFAKDLLIYTIKDESNCVDYANAERHCAPAGNFNSCMSHTIGNNFRQMEADCAEARKKLFKR